MRNYGIPVFKWVTWFRMPGMYGDPNKVHEVRISKGRSSSAAEKLHGRLLDDQRCNIDLMLENPLKKMNESSV